MIFKKMGLVVLLVTSCANSSSNKTQETSFGSIDQNNFLAEEFVINPGSMRWIKKKLPLDSKGGELWCHDYKVPHQGEEKDGGYYLQAIVIESYFSDKKSYECFWKVGEKKHKLLAVTVEAKDYPKEKLSVQPKKITLAAKDLRRVQMEQVELNTLYSNSLPFFVFDLPFIQPLDSYITSYYGTKRVYNNIHGGQHLGIDFRAKIGVPTPAANKGKIVLAKDLFYTGYTVIIDHGLDVFTVYAHLSQLKVKKGDVVERGEIVGLTGNTGRTSGPHLHWGVKIQKQWIDGFTLVKESQKYEKQRH